MCNAIIVEELLAYVVKSSVRIAGPVYAADHSANALRAFAVKIGL